MRASCTWALVLVVLASLTATSGCRVPGRGKAPGGKYRKCAKLGRAQEGSVKAGKVTCSWDGEGASCTPDPGDSLDLCILSGAAADSQTRANIESFMQTCGAGGVDMIVALGDTGSSADEIGALAKMLSAAQVPVGMLPGSTEPYAEYMDALDEAREAGLPVIDLSRVRVLTWGGVSLVTLPGIRDPYYLDHPGEGCGYSDGDVESLGGLIAEAGEKSRVVVLGVNPPRCDGPHGVDVTREGSHGGDAVLARTLLDSGGDIGVFGYIHEAGGAAVAPPACTTLAEGVGHVALWLNAGSIEHAPWEGEGGGVFSTGQGVVLQVADAGARFFVWRAGVEPGGA